MTHQPEEPLSPRATLANIYEELMEGLLVKAIGRMERTHIFVELHPENQLSINPATQVHETWVWYLQEFVMVRDLHSAFITAENPAAYTVIPNLFLQPLLYVKLVAIFDEAIENYILNNSLSVPRNFGTGLDGRLQFLSSRGVIHYSKVAGDPLFDVKQKRNILAHRPTTPANWQNQQITWQELESTLNTIEATLQSLGLIGQRPDYETFAERNSEPVPSDKPDVYMTHIYYYGLKENGKAIISFTQKWDYYRVNIAFTESISDIEPSAV